MKELDKDEEIKTRDIAELVAETWFKVFHGFGPENIKSGNI